MSRRGAGAASFRSSAAHSFAQFLDLRLRRRPPPPSASPTESFIVHPSPSSLFSLFPRLSRRRGFLRLLSSSLKFSSLTHFRLRLRIPGQSSDTQLERGRVSLSRKIRRACLPPPRRTHTLRLSAVSAFCHPESPAAGSPGNCRRVSAAPSRKSGRNHARESLAGCPIHVAAAVSAIVVVTVRAKTNGSATVSCSNRKKKKEESGRPSGRLESRESGIRCLGKIGRGPTKRRVVNVAALLATRPFAVFLLRLFGPVPVSKS